MTPHQLWTGCLLGALALAGTVQAQPASRAEVAAASGVAGAASAERSSVSRRAGRARPAGPAPYVYRATSRGDNLWDIAGAVVGNNTGIDRNQVMVAIFRANPQAFPEGNMHRIQKGLDLTVPSLAQIRAENRANAVALVAQHRKAYADRRVAPQRLYALDAAAQAAATAAPSAKGGAASAASEVQASGVAQPASEPVAEGAWSGWLKGSLSVLGLGLLAALLSLWWRKPMPLDELGLEEEAAAQPLRSPAEPAHADEVVATLYSEALEQPLDVDLPGDDEPVQGLDEDALEEAPLPPEPVPQASEVAVQPAPGEGAAPQALEPAPPLPLAAALSQAYLDIDRPQAAKQWQASASGPKADS